MYLSIREFGYLFIFASLEWLSESSSSSFHHRARLFFSQDQASASDSQVNPQFSTTLERPYKNSHLAFASESERTSKESG
jgi:hypothetical protein